MVWTNVETGSSGVAVLDDPLTLPLVLEAQTEEGDEAVSPSIPQWPGLIETSPAIVMDARDPDEDEEEDEDEDEEDADFFDDEDDDEDDLDDEDIEDEDLDEEEDEEEEEEEEEDDDF